MLEKLLNKINPGKYEFDGLILEYKVLDNGYQVRVYSESEKDPELVEFIDAFKAYVKDVDDELFVEACELFPEVSGISTHEFSSLLDKAEDSGKICTAITYFKNCIKHVANKRILYLQFKYIENSK